MRTNEAAFAKERWAAIDHAVLLVHHEVKAETEKKCVLEDSRNSQYRWLLREMAEAAQAFAISKQQTVETFDYGILQDAMQVCGDVHLAFHLPPFSAKLMEQSPHL